MTPVDPPADYATLVAGLTCEGWSVQPPTGNRSRTELIDPRARVRLEIHDRDGRAYALLRLVAFGGLIAEIGPGTPASAIAAAARALAIDSRWVDAATTVADLDFLPAPPCEQRLPPAIGHRHPYCAATAYFHPGRRSHRGEGWSVHGPNDAWTVELAAGVTGHVIGAILTATYRRPEAASRPLEWTEAHVALEGQAAYPCQVGGFPVGQRIVPRFTREVAARIVEDSRTAHERHAAHGAPEKVWDLSWNGEKVAALIYRPGALDEHGEPRPEQREYQPDDAGFYYLGGALLDWKLAETP